MVEAAVDETSNRSVLLQHPISLTFEPVGRWFETHCVHRCRKYTLSTQSVVSQSSEDEEQIADDTEDDAFLFSLDPTDWKQQDHYAVLGLRSIRSAATSQQIKQAYRKRVLRHHPDKRRVRGINVKDGEDDYFTCITRAYEIIGNAAKRRSYDSIDPEFDNSIPSKDVQPNLFYTTFTPVFTLNSKWSIKPHVPSLGNDQSTYDEVCHFYSFWYEFESWREYSYLDEEEKEKGENRDERRWIEKQNRAARAKHKKEETSRIRQLVDNAYATDPRIQKFKDEERDRKLSQKKAKQDAIRMRQEEEERIKRAQEELERQEKEKIEAEAQLQASLLKKKNEEHKKLLKKERKAFRTYAAKFSYFTAEGQSQTLNHMNDVEKLAENLSLDSLQELNNILSTSDQIQARTSFNNKLTEYNKMKEQEKEAMLASLQKRSSNSTSSYTTTKRPWTENEVQLLIKGVNVFPAGTQNRWEVIANFVNQHKDGGERTAKEVLAKAKDLQKNDVSLKVATSQKAYEIFEKDKKAAPVASAPSERLESVADQQIRETGSNPGAWSSEEQKLLEQALKTYPASSPDRWDKIAEVVSSRSKKDCMKRYKELAELVKAKKAAQAATKSNKS